MQIRCRSEPTYSCRRAICAKAVNILFATIAGNLDLRGAKFAELDLSGTTIGGEFRLGPTVWRAEGGTPGALTLKNTRVGSLVDDRDLKKSWPDEGYLHLHGFTFAHLGGFEQDANSDPRIRGDEWWDKWAQLDRNYNPHPYQQLANAFAAAGDRDLSDAIRYRSRVREQQNLKGMDWVWSWPLRWIAGFGVYPHWVLYWIAGISLAGTFYLRKCSKGVRDAGHTFLWCWGASFTRLLPVIEISREFTDFFNDPERKNLTGFQMFVFSIVGVVGWFLAAILVAAVSGVTSAS